MHLSDQEKYYFVQTLRHYLKTAASWNHYIRDNIAQKMCRASFRFGPDIF